MSGMFPRLPGIMVFYRFMNEKEIRKEDLKANENYRIIYGISGI